MSTNGIQTTESRDLATVVESLVMRGDISALSPEQRVRHYVTVCERLGLDPHSQPFAFLKLNGKEVMYAGRGATDQLAAMHRVNREIIDGPKIIDIAGSKVAYCVAKATHPNGRTETATATLPVSDPATLYMKLETKAKRRATLSILGLGMLDETEVDSIPGAQHMEPVRVTRDDDPRGPDAHAPPSAHAVALVDAIEAAPSAEAVRSVWRAHSPALNSGPDADREAVWAACVTAVRAYPGASSKVAARNYLLTKVEPPTHAPAVLPAADPFGEVSRHSDDETGDLCIADVVTVIRAAGTLAPPDKAALWQAALACLEALEVLDGAARLRAALTPPTPPKGRARRDVVPPPAAEGSAQDTAPTAGATMRVVLDESDAALVASAPAWAAYLAARVAARVPVFAIAGSHHKRAEAFAAAGVGEERRAQTLAAIEAREGRGPDAARECLDGYSTRRHLPAGYGAVIATGARRTG